VNESKAALDARTDPINSAACYARLIVWPYNDSVKRNLWISLINEIYRTGFT